MTLVTLVAVLTVVTLVTVVTVVTIVTVMTCWLPPIICCHEAPLLSTERFWLKEITFYSTLTSKKTVRC